MGMYRNILKYGVYTLSAALASEIALFCYNRWQRQTAGTTPADREATMANCVVWTNNLSQACKHSKSNSSEAQIECDNKYCYVGNIRRLVRLIDNAQRSIDLSMYIFTSVELGAAMLRAHRRGVRVRAIVDAEMVQSSGSQIIELHKNGIPVRYETKSTMLMHHKFCVIDGPQRVASVNRRDKDSPQKDYLTPVLIAGSTNWTFQGLSGNWDYLMCTSDKIFVAEFENEFERMWIDFERHAVQVN